MDAISINKVAIEIANQPIFKPTYIPNTKEHTQGAHKHKHKHKHQGAQNTTYLRQAKSSDDGLVPRRDVAPGREGGGERDEPYTVRRPAHSTMDKQGQQPYTSEPNPTLIRGEENPRLQGLTLP